MPLGMLGEGGLAPLTSLVSVLVFSAPRPYCFGLSCYPVCEAPIEPSVRLLILAYRPSKLLTLHYRTWNQRPDSCMYHRPITQGWPRIKGWLPQPCPSGEISEDVLGSHYSFQALGFQPLIEAISPALLLLRIRKCYVKALLSKVMGEACSTSLCLFHPHLVFMVAPRTLATPHVPASV